MKFWSIQTKEAWNKALENDYLEGNKDFICDESFRVSYDWLKKQMDKRLSNYKNEQPIWLWLKRPDMRESAHAEKGTEIVRLTLELAEEDVLLSDFERWHYILNNEYCVNNDLEDSLLEQHLFTIPKEETWLRIFEKPTLDSLDYWGTAEQQVLQGTTGRVAMENIISVEHFIAK